MRVKTTQCLLFNKWMENRRHGVQNRSSDGLYVEVKQAFAMNRPIVLLSVRCPWLVGEAGCY